jgi:hypothetical protein
MSKEQLHEITLPLDDIQDLFADPEPGSDRFVSGMDYIYGEVRVQRKVLKQSNSYKMTIELPREKITEGLQERTSEKIKRYCKFKAEQSHKELDRKSTRLNSSHTLDAALSRMPSSA